MAELELARKLLFNVAKVDPSCLRELHESIRSGKEGHAQGLVQEINEQLRTRLNFPRWWAQDRNFNLMVSPRDFDLVFTIRDRTGTDYSFDERSSGLKYFLSYYIQYRSHEPPTDHSEILPMDEPDAYLSSEAQQDLLKIFEAFAEPEEGKPPAQVVYVTHSPFLIDRNHAERIRVLEKGVGDEGTRVVRDAGRNHYEPLRSAFGAFVGETTFIGNCNLILEGMADQIILAGAAKLVGRVSKSILDTLDLNRLTLVPAGSASHVPYLVYLARGRDAEQPAVIVLLDGDEAGKSAAKRIRRGGPDHRELLADRYVLPLDTMAENMRLPSAFSGRVNTIEDLIPPVLAAAGTRRYLKEFCGLAEQTTAAIDEQAISNALQEHPAIFDAAEIAVSNAGIDDCHIDKVGFARSVVAEAMGTSTEGDSAEANAIRDFTGNFRLLFKRINESRLAAEKERTVERISRRVERAKKTFLQDYQGGATREQAGLIPERS